MTCHDGESPAGGRPLPQSSAFAGDDGGTPEAFALAFAAAPEDRLAAVVEALRTARVLIPVVARLDEMNEPTREGEIVGEKVAHAAMVTVGTADGRSAIPAFTSVAAMAAWRDDARPVPTEGVRAALAAGTEADSLLVLDPGSEHATLIPTGAVAAVATGEPWSNPLHDPALAEAVAQALSGVPAVVSATLRPGREAQIAIVLALKPGLDRIAVGNAAQHASTALAATPAILERVDSLELRLTTA